MAYHHNAHHVYKCHYHIIFCPKYRRKVLVGGVDERPKGIVARYAERHDILILAMEVMPDHVHLLLDCPLGLSPISIVKGIKQTSSVHLRREFPQLRMLPTRWARGSFFETVGSASLDVIKPYINNQKSK